MRFTTEMFKEKGACDPGLITFMQRVPSGVWDVTLASCIEHSDHFPWDWLAENMLSAAGKVRYLRYIVEGKQIFEDEREKLISKCRSNGGVADAEDIPKMARLIEEFKGYEAKAFYEATLSANYR